MVNDIDGYKKNVDFIFRNINNLNNAEKEVLIFTILEEVCKQTDFNKIYCPICGNESAFFLPYGEPPRKNALCPFCFSLERHRFFYLFLKKVINIDKSKAKILGINLENKLIDIFAEAPSVTYYNLNVNFKNDNFQNLFNKYKNKFFDVIFTTDINLLYSDIDNINYILKNDGQLIFTGTSDYKFKLSLNRLKNSGFFIKKYSLSDVVENELINKYSVADIEVFIARK